jgi:hypothetical protein
MELVPSQFEDKTWRYQQIERAGDIAIYLQTHKGGGAKRYEVVRIRIAKAHTWPNGDVSPERETYPGATGWGRDGFTFFTEQAARAKAATWRSHAL